MGTSTWYGLTHQCGEGTLMHQALGQLVGACCWFRWQLANGSKSVIKTTISYKGLIVVD